MTEENDDDDDKKKDRKAKMRRELTSLHQEMEIAQHGIAKNGQFRRIVPREQSVIRTRKRKLLESQDAIERTEEVDDEGERLRGPMKSIEDSVIQGSLIFGGESQGYGEKKKTDDDGKADAFTLEEDIEDEHDVDINLDEDDIDDADDADTVADEDNEDEDNEDEDEGQNGDETDEKEREDNEGGPMEQKDRSQRRKRRTPRRKVYRLRNFKSQRLAQKHGAALGAHALGRPKEAIQKLKQVAREAPSAPQVYSSLGLVYEDMLQDARRKVDPSADSGTNLNPTKTTRKKKKSRKAKTVDATIPDESLAEQLDLAKKAYGAYHVAAILCKRDYNLWLRAADLASETASIHASIMGLDSIADSFREYHREERGRWLEEAKNDYQTADNLRPPGIDIQAKLASVLMELGLFSDALTLLTDLKNHPDFESSYKAWVLYADLMLRIGHECNQWNRGVQNTSNYTFRRWLRKLSRSFDWKERRLQALSKALEAACGSKSCRQFIEWLKNRVLIDQESGIDAKRWHVHDEDGNTGMQSENLESTNGDERLESNGKELLFCSPIDKEKFETEKTILLERQQTALAAFDKTTKELDLVPESVAAQERKASRRGIVQRYKKSLIEAVAEFHRQVGNKNKENKDSVGDEKSDVAHDERAGDLLISASCNTVCTIASELIRHLLGMQLYTGGRLAGEAVSRYFRERFVLREKRVASGRKFDESQNKPTSVFALQREQYDREDNNSDDEDPNAALSDDEELDQNEDEAFLQSLQRGVLPPELKVLYGLSIVGEGGKNFLAVKCISDIDFLPQERKTWINEKVNETELTANCGWLLFQRAATEPLGRTAAYAFVADVVKKSGKEKEVSNKVALLFRRHVTRLTKAGMVDDIFSNNRTKHVFAFQRQNQIIKVLNAAACFEVERSEALLLRGGHTVDNEKTVLDVVETLSKLLKMVWKVETRAAIASTAVETIEALSRVFRLIPNYSEQLLGNSESSFLHDLIEKMSDPIRQICGAMNFNLKSKDIPSVCDFNGLPIRSSWLSSDLKLLALRSINLCVATNVSLFSGWETDEFNVRLMRGGSVPSFFGISISDSHISGYLSAENEESLCRQWQLINKHMKSFSFDFEEKLGEYQETLDYKETKDRHEAALDKHPISCYGEDVALSVMLNFSHACLLLAERTSDQELATNLLYSALSIVIPISEFCVSLPIWDSEIGRSAASAQLHFDWQNFDWAKDTSAPSNRPGYLRPSKRQFSIHPPNAKALQEWFGKENDMDPLSNLIAIPHSVLQKEWKKLPADHIKTQEPTDCVKVMERLDVSVRLMRTCYTEQATERACLNVASSLLQVAACKACQNPFLCIQQAALFASQASKGGTSDQVFHAALPKKECCTPLEALLILGRADCLQAVCFHPEAAFLCCYVAAVCSLHRDRRKSEFEWNIRWRIVAILAYDLSVVIRNSAYITMLDQDRKDDFSGIWEKDVIDELNRARSDGLSWKSSLNIKSPISKAREVSQISETGEDGPTLERENVVEKNDKERSISRIGDSIGNPHQIRNDYSLPVPVKSNSEELVEMEFFPEMTESLDGSENEAELVAV